MPVRVTQVDGLRRRRRRSAASARRRRRSRAGRRGRAGRRRARDTRAARSPAPPRARRPVMRTRDGEHRVQVLLLGPPVLALAGDAQAEPVAVEARRSRGVGDRDRRVVDAEEERASPGVCQRGCALARREPDQLQVVVVGVAEVERADPAGVLVPVRDPLRPARDLARRAPRAPARRPRPCRATTIAMCWNERSLLRSPAGFARPAGANSRQLDALVAEPEPRPRARRPRHALADALELQHLGVEVRWRARALATVSARQPTARTGGSAAAELAARTRISAANPFAIASPAACAGGRRRAARWR